MPRHHLWSRLKLLPDLSRILLVSSTQCELTFSPGLHLQLGRSASGKAGGPDDAVSGGPGLKLRRAFQLLGLDQSSATVSEIKEAYISLVKKHHPDSSSPHADPEKFTEIREAYKRCVGYVKDVSLSREIYASLEEELQDIDKRLGFKQPRRIAHRRYLTHDVGPGTYSQRHKAAAQVRLDQAVDNVFDRQFQKALENPHDKEVGRYTGGDPWLKTSQGNWFAHSIERVAEDKIRDSIARGDFTKLEGSGKPIERDHHENIAVDNISHRLNKMLVDSNCAPEWVSLDKEIRNSIKSLKERITAAWHRCGPHPMTEAAAEEWNRIVTDKFQVSVYEINASIQKFNLIVPVMNMQKAPLKVSPLIALVTSEVVPAPRCTDAGANRVHYTAQSAEDPLGNALLHLTTHLRQVYRYLASKLSRLYY